MTDALVQLTQRAPCEPLHPAKSLCVGPRQQDQGGQTKGTELTATYLRAPAGSGTKYHCGEVSNPQTTVAQDLCPHVITWDKDS